MSRLRRCLSQTHTYTAPTTAARLSYRKNQGNRPRFPVLPALDVLCTPPMGRNRTNNPAEGKSKKNKNKRRLPQWAHEEIKETAKRVREEHADPEGKGHQQEPQVWARELLDVLHLS